MASASIEGKVGFESYGTSVDEVAAGNLDPELISLQEGDIPVGHHQPGGELVCRSIAGKRQAERKGLDGRCCCGVVRVPAVKIVGRHEAVCLCPVSQDRERDLLRVVEFRPAQDEPHAGALVAGGEVVVSLFSDDLPHAVEFRQMLKRIGSFLNLIIVREVDERDVAIDPFAWIIQTIQIGIHFRPRQFIESCKVS